MKYLKRFNEGKIIRSELTDFCESTLAYMLDHDFRIECDSFTDNGVKWMISISKLDGWESFFYPDYKDYLIPFIELLSRRYTLGTFSFSNSKHEVIMWDSDKKKWVGFTLDQIMNGDDSIFPNTTRFKLRVEEKI